jgi:hypothetical protein
VRAKAIASFVATTAIVILSLPGAASAHGSPPKGPAARGSDEEAFTIVTQELSLHGSNGYKIKVKLDDRRQLSVEASRFNFKENGFGSVDYKLAAPQRRASNDIKAQVGNFGRINLHFVPEKTKKGHPFCKGGQRVFEAGHYVGSISFHGVEGFTQAHAHRVKGIAEREMLKSCPPSKEEEELNKEAEGEKKPKGGAGEIFEGVGDEGLLSVSLDGGKTIFGGTRSTFKAKGKEFSETNFIVTATRKRGRVSITSLVDSFEPQKTAFEVLSAGEPDTEAIVRPAAPFSGSGTFLQGSAKKPSWTGNLKVAMPGLGVLPLTRHGAVATLCTSKCSPESLALPRPSGHLGVR